MQNTYPSVVGCATALPAHYYTQDQLLDSLESLWGKRHFNVARLRQFHHNLQITGRHLAKPQEFYFQSADFGERNQAFIDVGLDLAQKCVTQVLEEHQIECSEISHIFFTTVTGLAVPSLEARLMNRMPFSVHTKRTPMFGLGCLAGAAGLARAADYLRGAPTEAVILLSVELCSLTLQSDDLSVPNLISSGLFGDGAAAVLMVGAQHRLAQNPGAKVITSQSVFFPNSEYVMGWEIGASGFKVVLSSEVPHYAETQLAPALQKFLTDHNLGLRDVACWVAHPGGPKVIEALARALDVDSAAFDLTKKSLAQVGNLSSASVLFVLKEALKKQVAPGSHGILLAMGPAFCSEIVLLKWH
jgi:alkylresorcinol/alkylpyrone synthase